jgi:dihydroneopterin aldolase
VITIELYGLEVFGRHGVNDAEREQGRTFLYDIQLGLSEPPRADRIEETVDYREVAACVREVSDARSFQLLESLAAAVAAALAERFPLEDVSVRVRKPQLEVAGLPAAFSAATATWISETS